MRSFCLWLKNVKISVEGGWVIFLPFDLRPIGVVRSPYRRDGDAPRQGRLSAEVSNIEIFPEYEDGLKGIESFSYLIILYWLDRAKRDKLLARPCHSDEERGVFATRSPNRPNPIGLCVVKLLEKKGRFLKVIWLDALDGSPIIDIKPYVPDIDSVSC